MSVRYKFKDQDKLYFVSFSVVYWIDVFIRNTYKDIILESLRYCQKEKGLETYAWCIMTSHVHLIIGTKKVKLEDIMRDFKSHTSRELKKSINGNIQESRKEWMLWMMQRAGKKNSNNQDFPAVARLCQVTIMNKASCQIFIKSLNLGFDKFMINVGVT